MQCGNGANAVEAPSPCAWLQRYCRLDAARHPGVAVHRLARDSDPARPGSPIPAALSALRPWDSPPTAPSPYYLAHDHRKGLPGALKPFDAAPDVPPPKRTSPTSNYSYPAVGAYRRFIQTGSWADGRGDLTLQAQYDFRAGRTLDVGDFCPGRQGDRGVHELGDGLRL